MSRAFRSIHKLWLVFSVFGAVILGTAFVLYGQTASAPTAANDFAGIFPIPAGQRVPMPLPATGSPLTYDVVYLKAPIPTGDQRPGGQWPSVLNFTGAFPGSSIWIHRAATNTEELLLGNNGNDAFGDLAVSFDGQWVYYTYFPIAGFGSPPYNQSQAAGSDIWKINVATKQKIQLTWNTDLPNSQAVLQTFPFTFQGRSPVLNAHPCPLPGGRFAFVSSRNCLSVINNTFNSFSMQLFVADDTTGANVEQIGYLNLGSALHPIPLMDGRILFNSQENQGLRFNNANTWGAWVINPDGTKWNPCFSAFDADQSYHFNCQLTSGEVVQTSYYEDNAGFGSLYAGQPPMDNHTFGSAWGGDPRNPLFPNGQPYGAGSVAEQTFRFSPYGIRIITAFTSDVDGYVPLSDGTDPTSVKVGRFTHPGAGPNNDLLATWSSGNGAQIPQYTNIVLIPKASTIYAPGSMYMVVPSDGSNYVYWPRALASYQTIYGLAAPKQLTPLANDGTLDTRLVAGTPTGFIGTSSLYKREAFPGGRIFTGEVTARFPVDGVAWWTWANVGMAASGGVQSNWFTQGAEAGPFNNSEIHAIRIVAQEPTSLTNPGNAHPWHNSGMHERLRILGEIPVRKFVNGVQPKDPDGNPDTSFMAGVPSNTSFKFQAIDINGMVLVDGQTWHQVRPGEKRVDCGGCHAHSQTPTDFTLTAANSSTYSPLDLTNSGKVPLLSDKASDQSGTQWDTANTSGLLYANGRQSPEFTKDIVPILNAHCVQCHTVNNPNPPGNLTLDDTGTIVARGFATPIVYYKLCLDGSPDIGPAKYGPLNSFVKGYRRYIPLAPNARSSPLMWKLYGKRLDNQLNTDWPYEATPGDPTTVTYDNAIIPQASVNPTTVHMAYLGTQMPPPTAVAGTYVDPVSGKTIQVPAVSDAEMRTLTRWMSLGCPIDNPADTSGKGGLPNTWSSDEQCPTLTIQSPPLGASNSLTVLRVGALDYYPGIDPTSLSIKANFAIDGNAAGSELSSLFTSNSNIWQYTLKTPITSLASGQITAQVKDKTGNLTTLTRTFSVSSGTPPPPSPTATTTTLSPATVSAAFSSSTQQLVLTANVVGGTTPVNEGSVAFSVVIPGGTNATATGNVSSGTTSATMTLPAALAAGTYTINAAYSDAPGGTNYSSSTASAGTLTVVPSATQDIQQALANLQQATLALQQATTQLQAALGQLPATAMMASPHARPTPPKIQSKPTAPAPKVVPETKKPNPTTMSSKPGSLPISIPRKPGEHRPVSAPIKAPSKNTPASKPPASRR